MNNREYYKEYYKKNKEKYKFRSQKYYSENKEKIKEYSKQYQKDNYDKEKQRILRQNWNKKNHAYRIFLTARNSAKYRDIEFSIELSDITIPEICPFLGVTITQIQGKGKVKTNASIDRKDPSKGYVKGNIQIISDLANRMKQDASKEELISFSKGILKYYEET